MNNLQTVLTSHFSGLTINVVQSETGEPGVTREQLGQMLGYKNPALAIKDIHARNFERFDDSAKCAIVDLPDSAGLAYIKQRNQQQVEFRKSLKLKAR